MKRLGKLLLALSLVAMLQGVFVAKDACALIPVDLELSLLVDVSGSISASEFTLQQQGYANAFLNPSVVSAIQSGPNKQIAVNLIYWSSGNQQAVGADWMLISDATSAQNFSNAILAANRPFSGNTGPGSAIAYATPLFFNNNYDGTRLVMDVSGDGTQNSGVDTSDARDAALAAGIDTINGITIGNSTSLDNFYLNNVIGGTDAFLVNADSFAAFGSAIQEKLIQEIGPPPPSNAVPEPASLFLLGSGFVGLVRLRRKVA